MTEETEERRGPGRPPRKFPVTLKRGYFPKDPDHEKHPTTGAPLKVERGEKVMLPVDEAKELIRSGIAERADDLP